MKQLAIPGLDEKYLVYQTSVKVMGLIKMPIDGNPNKTMGLIAHPNKIADFCVSKNGQYLFTCGGADLSVKMWAIDVQPIENAIAFGQQDDNIDQASTASAELSSGLPAIAHIAAIRT